MPLSNDQYDLIMREYSRRQNANHRLLEARREEIFGRIPRIAEINRQISAMYPPQEAIARSSIMVYFDADVNEKINQMWINVRCYNIYQIPVWTWCLAALIIGGLIFFLIRSRRKKNYD